MHALYCAFRDGAQDDAVLQTNRDDRILRHDNTHRNGGEHLSAVLDRTFLHHRDIDDHEKLLILGIDTRAFLRVERRANKLFLNLSRLRDLLQLVRAGMHMLTQQPSVNSLTSVMRPSTVLKNSTYYTAFQQRHSSKMPPRVIFICLLPGSVLTVITLL